MGPPIPAERWTCVRGRFRLASAAAVLVAVTAAERPLPAQVPAPPPAERSAGAAIPDGRRLFADRCSSCHTGGAESRAPAPDTLRSRSPDAIIESLVNGSMRVQGSRLTGAERRALAEHLTGQTPGTDVAGAQAGRCPASMPARSPSAAARPRWSAWSPTLANTRFQPLDQAGLSAGTLPRLRLKWAFGFPDASSAWAHPTVADDRLYVGSQNGTVYALDAASGCIHWTFAAGGGVRTAVAIDGGGPAARIYFGDTGAMAYALDASTGRLIWTRRVDDHPLARITGSPVFHEGRLYVPTSSYEESQGADPRYACCTFRGSVAALDAGSGDVVWKTHLVPEPTPRGTSSAGVTLWGPSGSAVWSAPTIDVQRGAIYVATGNAYSGPPQVTSDAVIALDLATGTIRWVRQVTAGDVYVTGCRGSGNPNCPERNGPDLDFGSPPMLASISNGRDLIVIGQKSGLAFAMDPDDRGRIVWQYRAGQGGVLGGIEWGSAVDGDFAYFAVSDMTHAQPGGLHAVRAGTGERAWFAPPPPPACERGRGCTAAQPAAVTAIPGAVLSGSNDGVLRAYAASNGTVLWQFDTNREFSTVNGVPANGASMSGPGPVIAGGMMFVSSGYGAFGGRPGNVLLAFGLE
jgi:polyvinyl alcohol dehydrogenase (cytochrome)